jgi:hypothetical protein
MFNDHTPPPHSSRVSYIDVGNNGLFKFVNCCICSNIMGKDKVLMFKCNTLEKYAENVTLKKTWED